MWIKWLLIPLIFGTLLFLIGLCGDACNRILGLGLLGLFILAVFGSMLLFESKETL